MGRKWLSVHLGRALWVCGGRQNEKASLIRPGHRAVMRAFVPSYLPSPRLQVKANTAKPYQAQVGLQGIPALWFPSEKSRHILECPSNSVCTKDSGLQAPISGAQPQLGQLGQTNHPVDRAMLPNVASSQSIGG